MNLSRQERCYLHVPVKGEHIVYTYNDSILITSVECNSEKLLLNGSTYAAVKKQINASNAQPCRLNINRLSSALNTKSSHKEF